MILSASLSDSLSLLQINLSLSNPSHSLTLILSCTHSLFPIILLHFHLHQISPSLPPLFLLIPLPPSSPLSLSPAPTLTFTCSTLSDSHFYPLTSSLPPLTCFSSIIFSPAPSISLITSVPSFLMCRDRNTAENCLMHPWITTTVGQ